jgi:hypothetical protein
MNKTAASNILSIANSLMATDPEKAHLIVKNLRGLIDDTRVAADKDELSKEIERILGEHKPISEDEARKGEHGPTSEDEAKKIAEEIMAVLTNMERGSKVSSTVAALVRVAFEYPESRPVLLPIIAAKRSKKASPKKASPKMKPSKITSPKKASPKKASPKMKPSKKASPKMKPSKKASPKMKPAKRRASIQINLSDARW